MTGDFMTHDSLNQRLYDEICRIPLIDPHSHIDPHRPTSRGLDDILGYHYYTELAHSAGMEGAGKLQGCVAAFAGDRPGLHSRLDEAGRRR